MNKTKIEWCDYTINPVKGLCPMACPYCYARRMYKRYHWDETIRFDVPSLTVPDKPSRIFVGSTMELFGKWIPDDWLKTIFSMVACWPEHTFILLTKKPQNLVKWSPFPDNCWVGVSATNQIQFDQAIITLPRIKAKTLFISLEPFLSYIYTTTIAMKRIDWLIIGQQTPVSKKTAPKVEWIREIVEAADSAGVPVFLKNNMMSLLKDCIGINTPYWRITDPDNIWPYDRQLQLRQEFPNPYEALK